MKPRGRRIALAALALGLLTLAGAGIVAKDRVAEVLTGVAEFFIPKMKLARERAEHFSCIRNLREIHQLGLMYADGSGTNFYPHSAKGGIASLQILVDYEDGLKPGLFICGAGRHKPARVDSQGEFQLDEDHCSYELVPWKLGPSDRPNSILAFDHAPYHDGKRNVVYLDTSVETIDENNFQELFEKQRTRPGTSGSGRVRRR